MLSELNEPPPLPPAFIACTHKPLIHTNLNLSANSHGTSIILSPRLAPFATPLKHKDHLGLVTAVEVRLPGTPKFVVMSIYAPPGPDQPTHRRTIESIITAHTNTHTHVLMGGDFNTAMQPSLDKFNTTHPPEWPWLQNLALPSTRTFTDTFRTMNPTSTSHTRYPTTQFPSSSRIDLAFASTSFLHTFPLVSAGIQTFDKTSDHHPIDFAFNTPFVPHLPGEPPPNKFFRRLSEEETLSLHKSLQTISYWCSRATTNFHLLPHDTIVKNTESILESVAALYHHTLKPGGDNKHGKKERLVREILSSLPPTTDPLFSEKMAELDSIIQTQMDTEKAKRARKMHANLVKGVRLKKTIADAINPSANEAIHFLDPSTPGLTAPSDERAAEIASDCLQNLGGDPHFSPDPRTLAQCLDRLPQCPPGTRELPPQHIAWDTFIAKLSAAPPSKAGGFDECNYYVLSLCPEPIQRWMHEVCNYFIDKPMPPSWQSSKVYLLYKKGNRQLPINYRPISLLGVVYKIIASHLTTSLADLANTHDLIHHSQVGGMANRRCSDHIWHLLALRSRDAQSPPDPYPHDYHLYVDFNKAFNSVPRKALRAALEKYNLPTWLVESIFHLYDAPYEHPAVNGCTSKSYRLHRGLRQGCPMSPLLFNLYLNLALFSLPHAHSQGNRPNGLEAFAFIDDLLFRLHSQSDVETVFNFFDTTARQLGLDMNVSKTEVLAMDQAPQFSFTSASGAKISTLLENGQPRSVYKYLGIYLFTNNQTLNLIDFINNEVTAFFTATAHLGLTHSELILLINAQLIPVLTYRLMAHEIPPNIIQGFEEKIWAELCAHSRLARTVSPKDRFPPRKFGGLGLHSLSISIHKSTYHTALRHLNREGHPPTDTLVCSQLLSTSECSLLNTFVDAAQAVGVRTHGWGPWNPTLVAQLKAGEELMVKCADNIFYPALIHTPQGIAPTIEFTDAHASLNNTSDFHFSHQPTPQHLLPDEKLCPQFTAPPILKNNAPAPPFNSSITTCSTLGTWVKIPKDAADVPLKAADLTHWGCTAAAAAITPPQPNLTHIYLDGAKFDPKTVRSNAPPPPPPPPPPGEPRDPTPPPCSQRLHPWLEVPSCSCPQQIKSQHFASQCLTTPQGTLRIKPW